MTLGLKINNACFIENWIDCHKGVHLKPNLKHNPKPNTNLKPNPRPKINLKPNPKPNTNLKPNPKP